MLPELIVVRPWFAVEFASFGCRYSLLLLVRNNNGKPRELRQYWMCFSQQPGDSCTVPSVLNWHAELQGCLGWVCVNAWCPKPSAANQLPDIPQWLGSNWEGLNIGIQGMTPCALFVHGSEYALMKFGIRVVDCLLFRKAVTKTLWPVQINMAVWSGIWLGTPSSYHWRTIVVSWSSSLISSGAWLMLGLLIDMLDATEHQSNVNVLHPFDWPVSNRCWVWSIQFWRCWNDLKLSHHIINHTAYHHQIRFVAAKI